MVICNYTFLLIDNLYFSKFDFNGADENCAWFCSLQLHVVYSLPIYPLILVAMICAKVAPRGHLPYLSKTNSTLFTEVHSNVGVICHQIYAVEFFVGLFSYSFLRNTSDRALRRFHSAMNYIGILFSGSGHKSTTHFETVWQEY